MSSSVEAGLKYNRVPNFGTRVEFSWSTKLCLLFFKAPIPVALTVRNGPEATVSSVTLSISFSFLNKRHVPEFCCLAIKQSRIYYNTYF